MKKLNPMGNGTCGGKPNVLENLIMMILNHGKD